MSAAPVTAARRAAIAALAHDESLRDHDGVAGAIVALALHGEPISAEHHRREYAEMERGDAIAWCERALRVRGGMAAREEV